jgi:hypothetical protein
MPMLDARAHAMRLNVRQADGGAGVKQGAFIGFSQGAVELVRAA